jgi:hypothetical protein
MPRLLPFDPLAREAKDRFYFLETGDRVARRTLVSYGGLEFLEIRAHILDRKFVAMQEG